LTLVGHHRTARNYGCDTELRAAQAGVDERDGDGLKVAAVEGRDGAQAGRGVPGDALDPFDAFLEPLLEPVAAEAAGEQQDAEVDLAEDDRIDDDLSLRCRRNATRGRRRRPRARAISGA
jgi:hypothetical protein